LLVVLYNKPLVLLNDLLISLNELYKWMSI
jgi:hypothetical protein